MNLQARARQLWADAAFLVARLWVGAGAYALLALGVGLAAVVAVVIGLALVVGGSAVAVVAATVLVAAHVARPWSTTVRRWLARRPLRRALRSTVTVLGRRLAAVTVRWLLWVRTFTRRERAAIAAHRDATIPVAYRPLPDGTVATLRAMAGDPATWRDLAYLVIAPAYAAAGFVVAAVVWVRSLELIVAATLQADWSSPTTWLVPPVAIVGLVLAPLVTYAAARGASVLGATLLSTGQRARVHAALEEQRMRRELAVDAAERERRRIERDLHDGAQQRLVALGMSLGLARETLPDDPATGAALVVEAHEEAKRALTELRNLARGIHPAILGDRGLDAALSDLVRRTPLPVSIIVTVPRRPPPSVESTAYFVVAEALTNVSRHAGAASAAVRVTQADGVLRVEVTDDGHGGVDPARGTGLAGLVDRVAGLDGRVTVDSPPGGPTTVRAEIPCAS